MPDLRRPRLEPVLFATAMLSAWLAVPARAAVIPTAGYQVTLVSPLTNALAFQSMVGAADSGGNRLVVTRDDVHASANHQVLSVDAGGVDTILSTQAQYPTPDRLYTDMLLDPTLPDTMFLLDGGSFNPCDANDDDGRLFRLDVPSGNFTLLASNFYDPIGMDLDPISGDLFIADRGCSVAPVDGAIRRWDGVALTTVPLSVTEALDIVFLPDGTYYLRGTLTAGGEGIFHVSGSTVLGTYDASVLGNGRLAYHDGSGSMPAGLYATGERAPDPFGIYWLPDDDANFVADQVVFVAELVSFRIWPIDFDAQGRLLAIDHTEADLVAISVVPVPALSWLGAWILAGALVAVAIGAQRRRAWASRRG